MKYRAAAQVQTGGTVLKIIIRNLARESTQSELETLFKAHGSVQSCSLVMDQLTGGSKGFGFANMPVPYEAKAAIKALNGLELRGSKIRVKRAEETVAKAPVEGDPAVAEHLSTQVAAEPENARKAGVKKDGTRLGAKKTRTFRKKS